MPRFAANVSMMFAEHPFPDRFAAAARAGFRAVECQFPYEVDAARLAEILAGHRLEIVLHNIPAGDWAAGDRGIACHPHRRDEFRRGVETAIAYATALGCPLLNCPIGILPPDVTPEAARAELIQNLRHAAEATQAAGLALVTEPINTRDIPGFFVSRIDEALPILDEVAHPNLRVQHDLYHAQVMDGDLARRIAAHLPRIGHIQIADNPGRHEPGTGEINYPFLFDRLDALGYGGWIGCEYIPAGRTEDGLGWLAPFGGPSGAC